jgi:hypothetical protein
VIMDCCALILVGLEGIPPLQARMTFTMGRHILIEMAHSFHLIYYASRYTGGDRLDHTGFLQLQRDLAEAGYNWSISEPEEVLADLRATYEPLLDGLARYLLLTLPGWNLSETTRDHWVRGPRGTLARRIIDDLSERAPEGRTEDQSEARSRWRRVRARFRQRE